MTEARRKTILVGLMLVLLAGGVAWSAQGMLAKRQAAQYAAEDLAACRRLAEEIESFRGRPAVAASQALGVRELGERIEAALTQAAMAGGAIEGIYPQPTRRLGQTPYLQKPTALALRGVPLEQLAVFLHTLTAQSGLSVRDLRLRTPHGDPSPGVWNAEVTIVYLIYAPASKARGD